MDSGRSATKIRDLRTGTPVWTAYAMPPVATGLLTQSMKTDVVVIGAGITGALTAEALSALGLSVTIVDRRPPGHGSTAASTAILQFEIDTPLTNLIDAVGFETGAAHVAQVLSRCRRHCHAGTAAGDPLRFSGSPLALSGREQTRPGRSCRRGKPAPGDRPPQHLFERGRTQNRDWPRRPGGVVVGACRRCEPVAADLRSVGLGFESRRAHQTKSIA